MIEKYGLFEEWLKGAVILDPTAGEGNFIEAFIALALQKDLTIIDLPLENLFAIEKDKQWIEKFHHKTRTIYGFSFPETNFIHSDIFFCETEIQADYLIGNPPWVNFSNLPTAYKLLLRQQFMDYGLVPKAADVLLGNARIDIATLVLAKTLKVNLKPGGKAFFYVPLSIFQNEGANNYFRKYNINGVNFRVNEIFDFEGNPIFQDVRTRYGMVHFERDVVQTFPIPYYLLEDGNWKEHQASPIFGEDSPLTVFAVGDNLLHFDLFQKISIPKTAQPRQGVNTCGANDIFIFDTYKKDEEGHARVSNKKKELVLPTKYLFPLVVRKNFLEKKPKPHKWILLPYDTETAKPLSQEEIEKEPALWDYLLRNEAILKKRKGIMIRGQMQKGAWWVLLGIGNYSFNNHKVLWEAFGRKSFNPIILSGNWQGNQALHAFIPLDDLTRAEETFASLLHPQVENYLTGLRTEGTCNWAQPGKVKPLLTMET